MLIALKSDNYLTSIFISIGYQQSFVPQDEKTCTPNKEK